MAVSEVIDVNERHDEAAAGPRESSAPPVPQVTIIEAKTGWRALDLAELWRYRELVYFLIWRDIKVRYKQTVLGAAWAVLQPVMTMLVFTVFFGRLGGMSKLTTQAYPVFVYAALLPWQLFSTSVTASSHSLVGSANMISKVYFPRLAVPIASVGPSVVDFLISACVMAILMVWYGVAPGISILLLPVLIIGTLVATLGVGTILSALTVSYRDFRYVVPFMVQLWMFASPVAYGIERVPAEWRLAYAINPMAGIIGAFRSVLLDEPVLWDTLAVSLSVSVVLLLVGVTYFRNVERRFADIV
jgi:lipopolysaccharide transport system permease protein